MTEFISRASYENVLPTDVLGLEQSLYQGIEQQLGYRGQERFVLFYYDPRSQRMMWRDSRSCGAGEVSLFGLLDATAKACGVSVGDQNGLGDHALLVDRVGRRASFSFRERAQEFLARRLDTMQN
jgi:hypothetical protein